MIKRLLLKLLGFRWYHIKYHKPQQGRWVIVPVHDTYFVGKYREFGSPLDFTIVQDIHGEELPIMHFWAYLPLLPVLSWDDFKKHGISTACKE